MQRLEISARPNCSALMFTRAAEVPEKSTQSTENRSVDLAGSFGQSDGWVRSRVKRIVPMHLAVKPSH